MAFTQSEGTGVTPRISDVDRAIFDLGQAIRAEIAARRLWLHMYPGENIGMIRWAVQ